MRWLFVIILFFSSEAQVKKQSEIFPPNDILIEPSSRLDQQNSKVLAIFQNVEYGIRTCRIEEFERELGTMISIAIGSGGRGYFSANQAASVLSEYLSVHKPILFEFSRIHEKGTVPYATGRLVYIRKGNQESSQVYVSLTKQDSRWIINQFNIY